MQGCDRLMSRVRMDWTMALYAGPCVATSGRAGALPVGRAGTLLSTTRDFEVEAFVAGHGWEVGYPGWS